MEIHEIIKKRREELNLTTRDLADLLGVASSTVSRYETKDIKNMGIDKIEALAKALKCTPAYLMGFTDTFSVDDELSTLISRLDLEDKLTLKKYIENMLLTQSKYEIKKDTTA